MPMIDAYIPENALPRDAEERLFAELTDILIRHEGLDPANERIRNVTWLFLHRPTIFRAGIRISQPIYRIIPSVPEGQYTDEARDGLVRHVTEAIARAEGAPVEAVSSRVWVFPTEIFDGGWGSRGVIRRLPDIMDYFGGDTFRQIGVQRLAAKRRRDLVSMLETVMSAIRGETRDA